MGTFSSRTLYGNLKPMQCHIELTGIYGVIKTKLPADLNENLRLSLMWTDPLNFNNSFEFYKPDQTFYSGFVHKICKIIQDHYGHYDVECTVTCPKLLPKHDWQFRYTYRPLQEECVTVLRSNPNGIVKAMAGVGKTVIMAGLISELKVPTLILVQNEKPLKQAVTTVRSALLNCADVGQVGEGYKDIGPITVMTVQSFLAELRNNPDGDVISYIRDIAECIIIDECHHAGASSYLEVFKIAKNVKRAYGVSATPERDDDNNMQIEAIIGPVIHEISYGDAIKHGLLCPIDVYLQNIPAKNYKVAEVKETDNEYIVKRKKLSSFQRIYKDYIVNNKIRNELGIQFAREANSAGKSCAIIVSRVEHGKEIAKLMPEAVLLTAQTPKTTKEQYFKDLSSKHLMTVVTTLMDEAVDIPSLGCVALMAGGKSSIKLIQRLRSTRTFEGETAKGYYIKKRGFVYYPIDHAPFLKDHSNQCVRILKKLVKQSPLNRITLIK